MKVRLFQLKDDGFASAETSTSDATFVADLVLVFGTKELLSQKPVFEAVNAKFPQAQVALCSTAGEIMDLEVLDETIVITAIDFEHTPIQAAVVNISNYQSSAEAGLALARQLPSEGLSYVLILSDGAHVNGTDLIVGINQILQNTILVTGAVAGDGTNFESTVVGLNASPAAGNIVAIGLYGDHISVGHGSMGGWGLFGPDRTITKSSGNVLHEIDHKNALELYRTYLGKYAEELPGSALLFPLSVKMPGNDERLVRTILSIDPNENTMTFAGDVPVGSSVRFMKANFDNLIEAAAQAATESMASSKATQPDYALLISCVGRKIILKNRVEEEIEAVAEIFPKGTIMSGFYSYGELAPFNQSVKCQLHNQTMTITAFTEK